jgi:hypothetical protein
MAKYNAAELGRVRLDIVLSMSVRLNEYTRREASSG